MVSVPENPAAEFAGPAPRILICDDDAAFRRVLSESLIRRGFDVTAAVDGGDAIEVWDHNGGRFHLCIVDFHMPRANGIEVIRHVHSHAVDSQTDAACVLMSAELTDAIRRDAEAARAYQVLPKPLRIKTLGEVIRAAMVDVHHWTYEAN